LTAASITESSTPLTGGNMRSVIEGLVMCNFQAMSFPAASRPPLTSS
jgi:hypothetical protein